MSDYISQKERQYQNEIVRLFRDKLNYEYLGSFQYPKNSGTNLNGEKNSPIIESELRRFLSSKEYRYTELQIEEAIRQTKEMARLNDSKRGVLADTNNKLYEVLTTHIAIQPDAEHHHENVYLFDFDNPLANNFAIAEEVSYIDELTGKHSRPDLVIYVNGIALCVIELKRSTVSLEEGIKQNLSNEIDLIPSFFTTTQFTVAASDKNGFKYATILTPQKFWCPWKRDDHKVGVSLSDKDSFEEFFKKETFFDLFRYGVINDGGTKKVMRPHQYHALQAAKPRLLEKNSGVIWHSQGSGKSLTMVWLAKYIRRNFKDARVLVITDRTELDMQINNTFLGAQESIHRAKSSDDLLDTLQKGSEWLICSLIHKFGRHIDPATGEEIVGDDNASIPLEKYLDELQNILKAKYPTGFKAKGLNKFVFVDECHRTQGGRLHEAMRAIMGDDVMFIGFTGTPLLHTDKVKGGYVQYNKIMNESEHRFGQFIHKYLHKEAVDDKVILDLQYEARDVEQEVHSKEKLDSILADMLKGVAEENQESIKSRWATMEKVYSSKERIERIANSIFDDMSQYPLNQDWCNAMLVAGSVYSAYKYYEYFQYKADNHILRDRVAVVTSYTASDSDLRKKEDGNTTTLLESKYKNELFKKSLVDLSVRNATEYEAKAKWLFTKQPSRMKLLIVVDKLLTGFDAPSATYLYIDKDMRDHNLFQAICRVNRLGVDLKADPEDSNSMTIFSHKEFGLIVDFKHLFNKIKDAITNFNDEKGGFSGYDPEDIEGLLEDAISKNKKRFKAAEEAYDAIKSDWERMGINNADAVVEYFQKDFENDPAKERRMLIYKIVQALASSYSCLSDYIIKAGYTKEEAEEKHKKVGEASSLMLRVKQASEEDFDVKMFDPQMRGLLDRFIRADEADCIIPATADFSFLDLLTSESNTEETAKKAQKEAGGSTKAAAEKIIAKERLVINDWKRKDKAVGESFAERLQAIIDEIKNETQVTTETIKKLIELLKSMHKKSDTPNGIESDFEKALWNNRVDWTSLEKESEIISLIKEISEYFMTKVFDGWKDFTKPAGFKCLKGLKKILGTNSSEEQCYIVHNIAANNL